MDFKVIYQPLALDDLEGIVRHVAEKELQAANRLSAERIRAICGQHFFSSQLWRP